MITQHIVIVDDDTAAALVTQYGLQKLLGAGADVQVAPSPEFARFRCRHESVDLVIVDPAPQHRAAAAFVKALREEQPQLPILILTAFDSPVLRRAMRALGINHYLAKSVDLVTLAYSAKAAMEGVRVGSTPAAG